MPIPSPRRPFARPKVVTRRTGSVAAALLIKRYPVLGVCLEEIVAATEALQKVFKSGKKLLVCGNGGSAADSEHIVGELMKGFLKKRPISEAFRAELERTNPERGAEVGRRLQGALPAVALTSQIALSSAISNDTDADMVFAQQVYGLGQAGDCLLGISTSGNSTNVINALIVARTLGLHTVALTGRTGGRLSGCADVIIHVPADTVAEIQELHLPVYHALCIELENLFFPS